MGSNCIMGILYQKGLLLSYDVLLLFYYVLHF